MSTDAVRAALAELVAATNPDGETAVADWRKAWTAARAALSEPAPGVPEGWQLVPKEPTEAMVDDGCEAIKGEHYTGTWGECGGVGWSESRAAYEAMLAAALSPTTQDPTP